MLRLMIFVLPALIIIPAAAAQQPESAADYSIRNIRDRLSDDGSEMVVEFEVWNRGGDAEQEATIDLAVIQTGQSIDTATLPPLRQQEIVTVQLTFPVARFAPGSTHSLRAAVGVNEIEATGSDTIRDNFAQISVTLPGGAPAAQDGAANLRPPAAQSDDGLLRSIRDTLSPDIDTSDPAQVAFAIVIALTALILVAIIVVLARLMFGRTPSFGVWQPPYAEIPQVDANSTTGRRQMWQRSALSSELTESCIDGNVHVRKLLLGMNGVNLAGWRVRAIRMSQYDMYGRVARSQVLAPARLIRRLNKIIRSGPETDAPTTLAGMQPVARGLARQFKKKVNDRNAALPLVMDIRLEGAHGDVRIVFELYQCHHRLWQRIDQWEPEMTVFGKTINESFTYTLFGQRSGETMKSFRHRLQDNLAGLLVGMIHTPMQADMSQDTPPRPGPPVELPVAESEAAPQPESEIDGAADEALEEAD